jgi:hypothetical protein
MIEILDVFKSDVFIIVISGVVIFAAQKLISEIWISPNLEFQRCLAKIETLMSRAYSLYKFEYKNNNMISSAGAPMDVEIENIRKELNIATYELIGAHSMLFMPEKWWLKIRGIDVRKAKSALLTLSVIICSKGDWSTAESKAEKEMKKVYKYLKFGKFPTFADFL